MFCKNISQHKKKMCIRQKFAQTKLCTVQKSEIVKSAFVFLCKVQKLHSEKYLRCRFAHFVHDGFSHICRFVHLCFVHVRRSFA